MSKRKISFSDSESNIDSSGNEEYCMISDPDNFGSSDNSSSSENESGEEYEIYLEKAVHSKVSKNYTNTQTKLESNHTYDWVEGELVCISDFDNDNKRVEYFHRFLIFSGYNSRKSHRYYWSTDPHLGCDIIKSAMSRNTFEAIKSRKKYSEPADKDKNNGAWRV